MGSESSSTTTQNVYQTGIKAPVGGSVVTASGFAKVSVEDITPEAVAQFLSGARSLADVFARIAEAGLDLSILATEEGLRAVRQALTVLAQSTDIGYQAISGIARDALMLMEQTTSEAFALLPQLLASVSEAQQSAREMYTHGLSQISSTTSAFLTGLADVKSRELSQASETEHLLSQRNLFYALLAALGVVAIAVFARR